MPVPSIRKREWIAAGLIAFVTTACAAQSQVSAPKIETKLQFDVASVRQDKSDGKPRSNIALGPGNVQGPSGGVLSARNFPLITYIEFAYRLADYQRASLLEKLPPWAREERFDIEARTGDTGVTKDQLRLMMQSLLADRFHLVVHYESQIVPVYALTLIGPGKTGPKLRPHPADARCQSFSLLSTTPEGKPATSMPDTSGDGFPTFCGGILGVPATAQDRYSFGGRDVPMSLVASSFSSWGNLGRPVTDNTGLSGTYDFVLDFTPDPRPQYATIDSGGPTFEEAVKQQLGLKLTPAKDNVEFLVVDHVEQPTEN